MSPPDVFPDLGYDPTFDVGIECPPPLTEADLPRAARVEALYLPPVGDQKRPASCAAWASTYGLATFTAAKRNNSPPYSNDDLIASPAYIYIQVRQEQEQKTQKPTPPCGGSSYSYYFQILATQGTPNQSAAPYYPDCLELTQNYQDKPIPPDPRFVMGKVKNVGTKDILRMKQLLASNCAIAYATGLYTDWWPYKGSPVPYVGNGKVAEGVGHCMLIIGYSDEIGGFLLQNSGGTLWGENGYVWMAYPTFSALAQLPAFYYED
jgi:C1A family cysteine protease